MREKRQFWKTFLPILSVVAAMLVAAQFSTDPVKVNLIYSLILVVPLIIWYYRAFVLPFKDRPKKIPTGFSFHTIIGLLFAALGMQYLSKLIYQLISEISPELENIYHEVMDSLGTHDINAMVVIYMVLLAPVVEELVFRGLMFRYARHAFPFWLANVWQAAFFGLIHANILQGAYAFVLGLFLGWIARRGKSIRYSIACHIIFNAMGLFLASFIDMTTGFGFYPVVFAGIAIMILGLWIYYTDFRTEEA